MIMEPSEVHVWRFDGYWRILEPFIGISKIFFLFFEFLKGLLAVRSDLSVLAEVRHQEAPVMLLTVANVTSTSLVPSKNTIFVLNTTTG